MRPVKHLGPERGVCRGSSDSGDTDDVNCAHFMIRVIACVVPGCGMLPMQTYELAMVLILSWSSCNWMSVSDPSLQDVFRDHVHHCRLWGPRFTSRHRQVRRPSTIRTSPNFCLTRKTRDTTTSQLLVLSRSGGSASLGAHYVGEAIPGESPPSSSSDELIQYPRCVIPRRSFHWCQT